jgi:hypothetical protein
MDQRPMRNGSPGAQYASHPYMARGRAHPRTPPRPPPRKAEAKPAKEALAMPAAIYYCATERNTRAFARRHNVATRHAERTPSRGRSHLSRARWRNRLGDSGAGDADLRTPRDAPYWRPGHPLLTEPRWAAACDGGAHPMYWKSRCLSPSRRRPTASPATASADGATSARARDATRVRAHAHPLHSDDCTASRGGRASDADEGRGDGPSAFGRIELKSWLEAASASATAF